MFGFSRGDMPESPPKDFANLPLPAGWTIRRFGALADLNAYARKMGVSASDEFNPHTIESAVVPSAHEVLLMQPGYFDPAKEAAIERHEIGGHANGLVHGLDGKGWGWQAPDGSFHPVATPAELSAVQARYAAPYDWSAAFARPTMTPPTASQRGPMTTQTAAVVPAKPPGLMGASARGQ